MDGFQWNLMIKRIQARGITNFSDGDVIQEYTNYLAELAANDPGETPANDEAGDNGVLPSTPESPAV